MRQTLFSMNLSPALLCALCVLRGEKWRPASVQFLLLVLPALLLGCGGAAPKPTPGSGVDLATPDRGEEALATVREKLYTSADLQSCQGAVRQMNVYLSSNPGQTRTARDDAARARLGCTPEEWTEINGNTYTPLDAHHLEQCLLLRDAAQSLQVQALPPAKRAEAAFAWVVRQISLSQRKDEVIPPSYVLRRGWGSAAQRTHAFLGMLRQLGIDGCVVLVPEKEPVVLAGALIGKDVYLFDSRLGLPLPGAEDGSVVTLAQLRANPELLKKLSPDDKHTYDVKAESLAKAEVGLLFEISELAPRMQRLQPLLLPRVKVVLAVDPDAQEKRFQDALKDAGVAVKVWNREEDGESPTRSLRQFLPPDQGGIDTPQVVDIRSLPGFAADLSLNPRWTRLTRYENERTPWSFMPAQVRALPFNSHFGSFTRERFAATYQSILARTEEVKTPEVEEEAPFVGGEVEETRRKVLSLDDLPRALVLRGQTEKAQVQLRHVLDALLEHRGIRKRVPDLDKHVTEWMSATTEAYAQLARVRDEAAKGRAGPEHVNAAAGQVNQLLRRSPLPLLFAEAVTVPLTAEATFIAALANQEEAERLQAKPGTPAAKKQDAWQEAVDGWYSFLRYHSNHPNWAAAHRMHARALEGVGKRDAARAIYENLASGLLDHKHMPLSDLEKTACLIRAEQLKK